MKPLRYLLEMSMHYPRTHQLLLRLLLEDFRLAQLFTGDDQEQAYQIRLEAEKGQHDLGIYKSQKAICLFSFKLNLIHVRTLSTNQTWIAREVSYASLIIILRTYLKNYLPDQSAINRNEQLAFQYLKSLETRFPDQGQRLSFNLN